MEQIATTVVAWAASGGPAFVARAIALEGFGGRRDGEVVAWRGEERVGSLLGGSGRAAIDAAVAGLAGRCAAVVDVTLGDDDAAGVGLACGGRATVLVQTVASIPGEVWERLAARDSVALATALDGTATMAVAGDGQAFGTMGVLDPVVSAAAARVLGGGGATRRTVEEDGRKILVELIAPASQLLVVGTSDLSEALVRQGKLLGWAVRVVDERNTPIAEIVAATEQFGPVDALVVLSHALAPSCAALAAALTGRCGYAGALGSRHTQAARADRLRSTHGIDDAGIAGIHGPVGLDLGARTPEETSLAVFAEILANRSGRRAGSLRAGSGPING